MLFSEVQSLFVRSFREQRLAHAYILVGDPRGDAMRMAEWLGSLVLCASPAPDGSPCGRCRACSLCAAHKHVDARWIEPEKKSRVFSIDAVRSQIIPWAACTSVEGGWKLMSVVFADRFNPASANAFLNTLEEPTPRTLFLLLTQDPGAMLPTILSRCQRVDLSMGRVPPAEPWRTETARILAAHSNKSELLALATAGRLEGLFGKIGDKAAEIVRDEANASDLVEDRATLDARVKAKSLELNAAVLVSVQDWYRDLLALSSAGNAASGASAPVLFFPEFRDALAARAAAVTPRQALEAIQYAERLSAQLNDRHIPLGAALSYWCARFP